MEFEKYFEEIENCDIESLNQIVVSFVNEWNENPFVNEFEHKTLKEKFFNQVCDKIIEFKKYPMDIHSYLVDEFLGKQAKELINNMRLPKKIVKDYETKFLETNKVYEKIDFIEARGIDFKAMEKSTLCIADFKALKHYANTVEKANIALILNKLNEARTRYSIRSPKKTAENKNLCAYLKLLKQKRESKQNLEL